MEVDGINLVMGGTAVTTLAGLAGAWIRARYGRTKVEPDPLNFRRVPEYVTRTEFEKHVEDNEKDHENLFGRLNRNDMATSEINGKLTSIIDDLRQIKGAIMCGRK